LDDVCRRKTVPTTGVNAGATRELMKDLWSAEEIEGEVGGGGEVPLLKRGESKQRDRGSYDPLLKPDHAGSTS